MESRYIPNDFSPLLTLAPDEPERHLKQALEDMVARRPPRDAYGSDDDDDDGRLSGLWAGPTGFAYLFLHVARRRPELVVAGRPARAWAEGYMAGARPAAQLSLDLAARVGVNCEGLAADAVRACLTQDLAHVRAFVARVPSIAAGAGGAGGEDDAGDAADAATTPDEMLQGRAGTLYMLRLLREWVAGAAPLVEAPIRAVTEAMLAGGTEWRWRGRRYLGAVHGDAGIVTQLVLTTPALAGPLGGAVARLLDAQLPGGNWPVVADEGGGGGGGGGGGRDAPVQFCHGAVGVVASLVALRPHFPALRGRIDDAVARGRACVWREGLLVKQPSICHGIFGSALVLPAGPQRDHFLAVATPARLEALAAGDARLFEPADYGRAYPTISGGLWSAAWTWLVCGEDAPAVALYTDV